ncbi:MAG: alpha-amylase family glycosyl hydrolase [Planctomycetaceae bacterium]
MRVGPPSWWTADRPQQLSLLIEGQGLADVRVTANRDVVRIDRVEPALDRRSAIVDVTVAAGAAPGEIGIQFESQGRIARFDWRLVKPPERKPQPIGPDDVIYLIMPDRFVNGNPQNDAPADEDAMLDRQDKEAYHGGDFAGIRQKLPYLADLGVTAIWLNPVYRQGPHWVTAEVAGNKIRYAPYHGYMPIDFYNTNPRFGSLDEYRELVAEAHRLGLKVIQDQILGYTGLHHGWVTEPPLENWFHGSRDSHLLQTFQYDKLADQPGALTIPLSAVGPLGAIERLYGDATATREGNSVKLEMPAESAGLFRLRP